MVYDFKIYCFKDFDIEVISWLLPKEYKIINAAVADLPQNVYNALNFLKQVITGNESEIYSYG